MPVEKWLRGPLDQACARMFDRGRLDRFGILSSDALSGGRHREWVSRDPMVLWHAVALASWCEANLGAGPDSLRELLASPNPPTR